MTVSSSVRRTWGILLLAWGALWADTGKEEPIKIPDFEVHESPLPAAAESWRYAQLGRFEALSGVSDSHASNILEELQKFHHALEVIYPAITRGSAQPLGLILANEARYRTFVPTGPVEETELSLLPRSTEKSVMIVNMDAEVAVALGDPELGSSADVHRQVSRQYLRYLFAEKNTHLPPWLAEGLAQTIADIEIRGSWLTYGKIFTDQNAPSGDVGTIAVEDFFAPNPGLSGLSFKAVFAHRSFLPFEQLFNPGLAGAKAPSSDSAWAKQAYAFVHFCLFGNKLKYKAPLIAFAERLQTESESEALFKACFGVGYSQMNDELRGYILYTRHKYQRYPLKPEQQFYATRIEFRDATDSETGALKGEALQLAGQPAAALETCHQAYLRGARSADFLSVYAANSAQAGEKERAQALVDFAVKSGTTRPSAFVLQARLRLEQARAAPAGADSKLSDLQLASIFEPLTAARKLSPPLPETYELMAEAWLNSASTPTKENLSILDEGIRRFPRRIDLLTRSFELYRRAGDVDKAASIARLGTRLATDTATKEHFEKLTDSISNLPGPKS